MLNSELITQMAGAHMTPPPTENEVFIDRLYLGNMKDFERGKLEDFYAQTIKSIEPGLNMILIHTAFNDPEMKSITKDHPNFGAEWRQIDLDFFPV